jgi:PII-like signaling protein
MMPCPRNWVDTEAKVRGILPELDEMLGDGLMTLEKVEVITYRAMPPGD